MPEIKRWKNKYKVILIFGKIIEVPKKGRKQQQREQKMLSSCDVCRWKAEEIIKFLCLMFILVCMVTDYLDGDTFCDRLEKF